jgi:hypothetical protein
VKRAGGELCLATLPVTAQRSGTPNAGLKTELYVRYNSMCQSTAQTVIVRDARVLVFGSVLVRWVDCSRDKMHRCVGIGIDAFKSPNKSYTPKEEGRRRRKDGNGQQRIWEKRAWWLRAAPDQHVESRAVGRRRETRRAQRQCCSTRDFGAGAQAGGAGHGRGGEAWDQARAWTLERPWGKRSNAILRQRFRAGRDAG